MGTSTISIAVRAAPFHQRGDVRLREAEHRHGSALQILSNLVRRSLRDAESEETREVLSSVRELTETLVRLHKLCLEQDGDVATLLRGMARQWQRMCNGHIRIEIEAEDDLDMPQSSRTVAILIAQELVQNAIRHAFPGETRGTISIRLSSGGNNEIALEVEDDGVGDLYGDADSAQSKATAHGRSLVRDLSLALGGTVRHDQARQGAGRCVTVTWPL